MLALAGNAELTTLGLMHPLKVPRVVVGLKPTTPQNEAGNFRGKERPSVDKSGTIPRRTDGLGLHLPGIRMLPAPSAQAERGTHPMATRAASPPDDPPGERSRFQGLRVRPQMRFTDSASIMTCITFPLQSGRAPASRKSSTVKQSASSFL
jgi:hypothetical protein